MRVLVADDESLSRENLVRKLREQYPEIQVEEYDDGSTAWSAVQNDSGYDLVITDMQMITMDGPELARKIHGKYPGMQILFYTAESETNLKRQGIPTERCLYKPVGEDSLKEKMDGIRELPPFELREPCIAEPQAETAPEQKRRGFFSRLFK